MKIVYPNIKATSCKKEKKMKVIPDQKICWDFVLKKKIDSFFTVYHHFYDILKVQNGLSALEN